MKNFRLPLSILAAVLVAAGSAFADPVVLNGSFESPDVVGGSIANGGTFWTPSGSGVFMFDNVSGFGQTPFGSQYLALNPGRSDSQTISGFQLGTVYTFSAYFADLINSTDPALTVTLSGVISLSQTFTAPVSRVSGTAAIPFRQVTFTLPALTVSGALTLTLTNASTNGTIAVDNVSIVPEPSSVLAAFVGLGVVGCAFVKRRTQLQS